MKMCHSLPARKAFHHSRSAWPQADTLRDQAGSSLLELALVLPLLILLLAGAVDFGQVYYVSIEVTSAAEAGAFYGLVNAVDTSGMRSAAILDAADVPGMTATSSWGCECSDGTNSTVNCSPVPSCSVNLIDYVDVVTAFNYQPMMVYGILPSSIPVTGHSHLRVSP